jgi:hypothetical protein
MKAADSFEMITIYSITSQKTVIVTTVRISHHTQFIQSTTNLITNKGKAIPLTGHEGP